MRYMKRLVFMVIPVLCMCGCTLEQAHSGKICPPPDRTNPDAKAYVYQSGEPAILNNAQCPDEESECTAFSPDHRLNGHYYCLAPCNGAQKSCNGKCIDASAQCEASDSDRCPASCLNNCDSEKRCKDCVIKDQWSDKGECIPVGNCADGNNPDGSCKMRAGCVIRNNPDGSCINTENCANGNNPDGSCKMKEGCVNGNNPDGSCTKSDNCLNGNHPNGSCINTENCLNGNNPDGSCKCADNCTNTCDSNGACIDNNHNHMIDIYEIAEKQGQDCQSHTDCDSMPKSSDGFCDSYLGYTCSTKCTSDDQCVGDDPKFTYICRSDGRCAPDAFITEWELPINNNTLTLYFDETANCKIRVNWGDDNTEDLDCGTITHQYSDEYDSGTVTIKIETISGEPAGFHVEESNSSICRLKEIVSFGDMGLGTNAFIDCTFLKKLSSVDIPNPQKLTTMERMFKNNCSLNYPLNNWDVSNVVNMNKTLWMPNCAGAENDDDKITNIHSTFNQPLDRWDVSNVTTMQNMLGYLPEFNQPLNSWDVSKVTEMAGMFGGSVKFDQPLEKWDVSNVKTMNAMFYRAYSFNQPLNPWNVTKADDLKAMFQHAIVFNQDLSAWAVSKNAAVDKIFYESGMSKENLCAILHANVNNKYWPDSFISLLSDQYECQN